MLKRTLALALAMLLLCAGALAENALPQIDNSTARIPITDAIYALFTGRGYTGPAPMCSKTHGAWLNLASGDADIIFLIAPSEDELQACADAGVDIEMKVYGYDGLVFMGNASNPVESLTCAQIRSIYRGDIPNWYYIDYDIDADIQVYIRNPESGSQRLFENLVWNGYEMPDFTSGDYIESEVAAAQPYRAEVSEEMSDVTYSVMQARYSIGFNIMSYVDNVFMSSKGLEQTVVTTGQVNLRSDPSLDGARVGTVDKGAVLKYLGDTRFDDRDVAWYRVEYAGDDWVWVSSRYSELDVDNTSLKLFSINGYEPTTENFANGNYPYVTTSYVAIRADEPEDSPARRLFDWVGSDESRAIIEENSTLSVGFTDSVVVRTRETDYERCRALAAELADRDVTRDELKVFTQDEVELLWQAVYAHSGKRFFQPTYQAWFEGCDWYSDAELDYADAQAAFNDHQAANLAVIGDYLGQLRRARANVQPRALDFDWNETPMTGDDVTAVQQALENAGIVGGYHDDPGAYQYNTQANVQKFQERCGLPASGQLDAQTRLMLVDPKA